MSIGKATVHRAHVRARGLISTLALRACVVATFCAATPLSGQTTAPPAERVQSSDWASEVRQRTAAGDLTGALGVAANRLRAAPQDADAQFWLARILGWLGRWQEAEAAYETLLRESPLNGDYLIGLANMRVAQGQNAEALVLLDRVVAEDGTRADLHVTRGRALRELGRLAEARAAFQSALLVSPTDRDAGLGLRSLRPLTRQRLTASADVDTFNFSDDVFRAFSYGLRSAWNTRWSTDGGLRLDQRAGRTAWRVTGSVARRLAPRVTATFGASAGPGRGVVSSREVGAGLGIGIPVTSNGPVRGLELTYDQRWLVFDGASVVAARTSALVYLPREWLLSLAVTAARSEFSGLGSEWHPSAVLRVTFPLIDRTTGHAFWASGSENYALRDQIGRFRATTIGGGVRQELPRDQELTVYVAWQRRTAGRAQTSLGISHGFRF